jgi:hypothetical protein
MYFWEDDAEGAEPYFSVPATGIEDLHDSIRMWPFNDVGYTMFPMLNLAVGGSGAATPHRAPTRRKCWSTGCASSKLPGCGMHTIAAHGCITPFAGVGRGEPCRVGSSGL